MTPYNYFTQEGGKFLLKTKWSTAALRAALCLAIAVVCYTLVPKEKKIGAVGAGFFTLFALINLLKATRKLTIDPGARTVTFKNNALTGEMTYSFDDFQQFYVLTSSYGFSFIKLDSTAFLVFDHKGGERRVPVVTGLFSSRPAQNAVNETSQIMGIEAA